MIRRNSYIYILLPMIMFLSTMNMVATIIALIFYVIFTFIFLVDNKGLQNSFICKWILVMLVVQNLILGIGAHLFGNFAKNSLQITSQFPFIFIILNWCFLILKKQQLEKRHRSFILLILFMIASLIIGRGNINSILINIRNMTCLFMLYDITKYYLVDTKDIYELFLFCMKIAKILLVFGIILLIFGYELYEKIGIREVYLAKGSPLSGSALDGRFYTTLIHSKVTRMGSLLYEPVNLAYLYSGLLIISTFFLKRKASNIIPCLLGLILTFGKGGYMIALFIIVFILLHIFMKKILYRFSPKVILTSTLFMVVIGFISFSILYYKNIGAASSPHFWAIERTYISVLKKPIGHGLGTGGNMSNLFNSGSFSYDTDSSWLSSGGESALMSFLYQIGIQGTAIFIYCIFSLRENINNVKDMRKIICYILPVIIILISILQDNTYTPQCITIYMLILGAEKNKKNTEGKQYCEKS